MKQTYEKNVLIPYKLFIELIKFFLSGIDIDEDYVKEELENKIESYSHGMRQKIHIIGALLHKPNNWILVEPITGLDPKASYDLKKIMKDYANEGRTVFFSTHILEIAEKEPCVMIHAQKHG